MIGLYRLYQLRHTEGRVQLDAHGNDAKSSSLEFARTHDNL